mmetsp:Transcript_51047/g.143676  ORF Transcript_51047/g.143676 Transcript_51047/m.143676 type:complete len:213 (+) Transcript_51047:344-982(+)
MARPSSQHEGSGLCTRLPHAVDVDISTQVAALHRRQGPCLRRWRQRSGGRAPHVLENAHRPACEGLMHAALFARLQEEILDAIKQAPFPLPCSGEAVRHTQLVKAHAIRCLALRCLGVAQQLQQQRGLAAGDDHDPSAYQTHEVDCAQSPTALPDVRGIEAQQPGPAFESGKARLPEPAHCPSLVADPDPALGCGFLVIFRVIEFSGEMSRA